MADVRNLTGVTGGNVVFRFNGVPKDPLGQDLRTNSAGAESLYQRFTDIESEVIRDLYEPKDGLTLMDLRDDLNWGIKKTKYYRSTAGGRAGVVEGIDPEIARVSVGLQEIEEKAHTFALGFDVDIHEVMAAPQNSDVWDSVREHDMACDRGLWEELDRGFIGDDVSPIRPFFGGKNGDVGEDFKIKGGNGGYFLRNNAGEIVHLTVDTDTDVMADALMGVLDQVYEETKKQIKPNKLGLPLKLRNLAARKRMKDTGESVLTYIVTNSPYLSSEEDILGIPAFEGYFPGKGNKPALDAVAAWRKAPDVVDARILSPRRHSIQQFSFGYCMVWSARATDVRWKRPQGVIIFANNFKHVAPAE